MKRNFRTLLPRALGSLAVIVALSSCLAQSEPAPSISAFLKQHPELGTATQVEDGKVTKDQRLQHVISSSGRHLLFTLKGEQVYSVHDVSRSKRVLLWPSALPTATPAKFERISPVN